MVLKLPCCLTIPCLGGPLPNIVMVWTMFVVASGYVAYQLKRRAVAALIVKACLSLTPAMIKGPQAVEIVCWGGFGLPQIIVTQMGRDEPGRIWEFQGSRMGAYLPLLVMVLWTVGVSVAICDGAGAPSS